MSLKKTLLLSVVLALAGAYIYMVELPAGEKKEKQDQLFSELTERAISEIAVQKGQDSFLLKNIKPVAAPEVEKAAEGDAEKPMGSSGKGSDWQLGEILGAQLDDGALTSLTSALLGLKVGESLPSSDVDKDLSIYGLSSPELVLSVSGVRSEGGSFKRTLRFGKKNEYVKLRYLQVQEQPDASSQAPVVYLVPETLFISANRAATDFRKKTFISFLDADVKTVSFNSQAGKVSLEARPIADNKVPLKVSKWALTEGSSVEGGSTRRASEALVAEILRDLRNAKASAFIDGEEAKVPEKFGLTEGTAKVSIGFSSQGREPLELRFAVVKDKDSFGRGPGTYVSMSGVPSVFFVDGDLSAKLFKSGNDLRDRQLFQFDNEKTQKIEISKSGAEPVILVKASGDTWNVADAAGATVSSDATFARQYVADLALLRADGFPEESRDFGFETPSGRVVVSFASEGAPKATLVLGKEAVNGAHFAGILVGDEKVVAEPFILSAEGIAKAFPRREVLVPVPTSAPEVAAEGAVAAPAAEIVEQSSAE
jgi:hypothetical protein